MEINKIKKAAEIAKAKTNEKRWIAAIDKAVAGVESGNWIVTELAHGIAVTTESGETYFANGSCQCKAFALNTPCKHRALARLIQMAQEADAAEQAARRCDNIIADIKTIARESLIADITNTWPKTWPPLAVELMARFRVNSLNFLADDMLQGVLAAIA
jgi:hypothetical protein